MGAAHGKRARLDRILLFGRGATPFWKGGEGRSFDLTLAFLTWFCSFFRFAQRYVAFVENQTRWARRTAEGRSLLNTAARCDRKLAPVRASLSALRMEPD